MRCSLCSFAETRVLDSREIKNGQAIRRRRECEQCHGRFSTYEEPEVFQWVVVKRGGRKEEYDREKLKVGIAKALEKRPGMREKIGKAMSSVEQALQKMNKQEFSSREVGRLIMRALRGIDEVAYLRFVSVYKSFGSMKSFQKEIKRIEDSDV